MKHFVTVRIWDFLLCLLCQIGLVFNLFSGFLLEDKLCKNMPLVILILAVLNVIFFIFSYNRRLTRIGIIAGAAALVIYVIRAASAGFYSDETAHSLGITAFLIVVVAILVFLLGRTRPGIIVLFVLGNFINVGAHFLQYDVILWTFLIFEVSVILLFLYRTYFQTVSRIHSGSIRIPSFVLQSIVICVLAFVIGCGAYQGIVKPLEPPTRELKLLTVLEDMDILKVFGVSTIREMLDPDKLSQEELQQMTDTDQLDGQGEDSFEKEEPEKPDTPASEAINEAVDRAGTTLSQLVYNLFHNYGYVWIIIGIAAALAACFIIRNLRRKRWRDKVNALSPENQVYNYYQYFLSRFAKLGYRKPPQSTLHEYAENLSHEMEAYETEHVTFEQLTGAYIRTRYGGLPASTETVNWFQRFYEAFPKNVRKEIGFFRYCRKYFIL